MRLILASASSRRAELLTAAGLAFDTLAVDVDERSLEGEPPAIYVRRLAAEKSARAMAGLERPAEGPAKARRHLGNMASLFSRTGDVVVLGADTAVVVDGHILGKPRDDDDAEAMLRRLAGRRHEVLTGISLRRGDVELGRTETTAVFFAPLGDEEVARYVQSGEGRDKAGAYAIQGLASRFVRRIEGSYSNVVGLPVAAVYELLQELKALPTVLASEG